MEQDGGGDSFVHTVTLGENRWEDSRGWDPPWLCSRGGYWRRPSCLAGTGTGVLGLDLHSLLRAPSGQALCCRAPNSNILTKECRNLARNQQIQAMLARCGAIPIVRANLASSEATPANFGHFRPMHLAGEAESSFGVVFEYLVVATAALAAMMS